MPSRASRDRLADALSVPSNKTMVKCSHCVEHNVDCYYDSKRSNSCAECIRKQRTCDGTFSLSEFKRVGNLKRGIQKKSRDKRREIALLRERLAQAEKEDVSLQDSLSYWEDVSDRMLKKEMVALGVIGDLVEEQEVAPGVPEFGVVSEGPVTDIIDWSSVGLDQVDWTKELDAWGVPPEKSPSPEVQAAS